MNCTNKQQDIKEDIEILNELLDSDRLHRKYRNALNLFSIYKRRILIEF